jgi:uncharacterized membrane protein
VFRTGKEPVSKIGGDYIPVWVRVPAPPPFLGGFMRKKIAKTVLFITIIAIFAIIVFSLFLPNDLYTIDSAKINYKVSKNGIVSVNKVYNLRMLKPYRFITMYENLKFGSFIEKPYLVSSKNIQNLTIQSSTRMFGAKILFSKDMQTRIVPQNGGDSITLRLSYAVSGVTEVGKDYKLISMKVWNENVDTKVKKVYFNYDGPKPLNMVVYSSSPYKKISETEYEFFNIYPKQPIVIDMYYGKNLTPAQYYSSDKYLKDIKVKTYGSKKFVATVWYISIFIITLVAYFFSFKFFGTEYKTEEYEYFRDIPYNDPPILVNSIIKLSVQSPDRDGINSLILRMVKEGSVKFIKSEKGRIIGFKVLSEPKTKFGKEFLSLFGVKNDFADVEIIFKDVERDFKKDLAKAKEFYYNFIEFKNDVLDEAKMRRLLSKKGYYLSLFIGVFAIFNSIFMLYDFSSNFAALASLMPVAKTMIVLNFSVGLIPFFLNSVIFGRWTKEGIEYYRKWKAFEKFLTDYSLISSKPPESIVIWEDYLIYATALGIAKEVRKSINKLGIVDIKTNDIYYGSGDIYYLSSIYYLSTIGAPKSSGTGGGGFSGSSSGGGFSGGGMSAG